MAETTKSLILLHFTTSHGRKVLPEAKVVLKMPRASTVAYDNALGANGLPRFASRRNERGYGLALSLLLKKLPWLMIKLLLSFMGLMLILISHIWLIRIMILVIINLILWNGFLLKTSFLCFLIQIEQLLLLQQLAASWVFILYIKGFSSLNLLIPFFHLIPLLLLPRYSINFFSFLFLLTLHLNFYDVICPWVWYRYLSFPEVYSIVDVSVLKTSLIFEINLGIEV